jgi:hypothetical protein
LETRLRSVTVCRNYILSLLVISACSKLVKHLSQMPNEYSLYMRAILSVFSGEQLTRVGSCFLPRGTHAAITDKTVVIFVAIFLFFITAFGLAAQVAFYDRDSNLRSARSSWFYSFLSLNGMGGTQGLVFCGLCSPIPQTCILGYVFAEHAIEPNSYGFAGFYFCVTTLIGNLILSNLVVNVLGERYSKACEELVKSKRKLQIDNLVRHGRHILLRKLYFRSMDPESWNYHFLDSFGVHLPPFFPWLANK